LPEARIARFARRHDLRIDWRQRPAGVRRLRLALHDRPDAVHPKSVTGFNAAVYESRFLASRSDLIAHLAAGRLCGAGQAKHQQAGERKQAQRKMASGRCAAL
jgi:hypothetical protein